MKKTIFIFLFALLTISMVLAGNGASGSKNSNTESDEFEMNGLTLPENYTSYSNKRWTSLNQISSGNYTNSVGKKWRFLFDEEQGEDKIEAEDIPARVKLNLSLEYDSLKNTTTLVAKLSNGKNSSVRIMPDTASQRAIERLQLKVCNPDEGCQIELKEVGEKDQTRATYEVKAKKEGKFLGLFKAKIDVEAQVDAETGEIIKTKKDWWAFLASE